MLNLTVNMTGCDDDNSYDDYIEQMRKSEFPSLADALYLDHAGTTLYSKRLMDAFRSDMMSNLLGNPHSASLASQRSTQEIDSARIELLKFFAADAAHFDIVFTANATAAIKLVADALRDGDDGLWFGYHIDSHTSLVGVRELAEEHHCFETDEQVEQWIGADLKPRESRLSLFAYPAQSNMNGRRLPLVWCRSIRQRQSNGARLTLLDAAAYASSSPLDFTDQEGAPDFTAVSLSKIFGFPDLGVLIVRKHAAHALQRRKYFGGGTVDMVTCVKEQWHVNKSETLHEQLEDGTLPVHGIVALRSALRTHGELFGTMERVARHTTYLAERLYKRLSSLKHGKGKSVCTIHKHGKSQYGDPLVQGPSIAFNIQDSRGCWISNAEVEKLANVKNIHLRTGGVCNPGGVAATLDLEPWEIRDNFSAGHRCGSENDILNNKPTGIIRVSLGAMSTRSDVDRFSHFLDEFFVTRNPQREDVRAPLPVTSSCTTSRFYVESLTVYPIKSCAGWQIPANLPWPVRQEGLAWDREWCIVHESTERALSQKQYPGMALIRPHLDFKAGVLHISLPREHGSLTVPLSRDPRYFAANERDHRSAVVCGDSLLAHLYIGQNISSALSNAVGVPCKLARFPRSGDQITSVIYSEAYSQPADMKSKLPRSMLPMNESPILTISRSSLNRLNEQIKEKGGKAAHASVFRANIVLAEKLSFGAIQEQPWIEDGWNCMQVGGENGLLLNCLGGCRRCQMICIDQENGERNHDPFLTLAKTRRIEGKVLFGIHCAVGDGHGRCPVIKVGDGVTPSLRHI